MYKLLYTLLSMVVASLLVLSCNSAKHTTKRMPGKWQAAPVVADGDNKEWPSPYPYYDDKAMLGYAITNDQNNLYITIETGDLATQCKILTEGLTVWIDKTGSKNEETAINYPIPLHVANKPSAMHLQPSGPAVGNYEQQQRMDLEDKIRAALTKAKEFSLQGFKSCNLQFPVTEKDSCGIEVHLAIDSNNVLVWEAIIPFRSFYYKSQLARSDKGKVMSICIETVGMAHPDEQSSGPVRRGSIRPTMSIGGFGTGMGMQMGGGGRPYTPQYDLKEPMYKSTKTYRKFGLAFQ